MSQYARNIHDALVGIIPRRDGLEVDFTGRYVDMPNPILEYKAKWPDGREEIGWAEQEDGEVYTYDPDDDVVTDGDGIVDPNQ